MFPRCSCAVLALFLALCAQNLFAQDLGTISGTLFDAQSGQPIRNARIEVEGKPDLKGVSNSDGTFRLTLPPGKYKLKFIADNYTDTTVDEIEVKAGETVEASTVMPVKGAVQTVEVVEKVGAVAANAEAMLIERKLANVVQDAISSDEIKRTVASDAAGAVEKVTGVSIVDNGYVYVRGLGERYSATMLNNAVIPTTEPEKRVVPLDLFPANLIDSIKVLKTYSPDLPGEFSGGLVQMRTVEFPNQRTLRFSASYGFNTITTNNRFRSYPGGGLDSFGFDDGNRRLPAIIPRNDRLIAGRFTDAQFTEFGRSFQNNWVPVPTESMRPSQSYSMAGGDSFWKGKIGLVGAITFTNQPQNTTELQRYLRTGSSGSVIFTDYTNFGVSNESVRMGGVLNVALRLNATNKILIRNTLTRDTDKEGRVFTGLNGGTDAVIEATRLRFVERGLLSTGIEGEHSLPKLANSLFNWQFTYSNSRRDEPDLRETVRGVNANGSTSFLPNPDSGIRFFSNLNDKIYEPLAEFSTPFFKGGISGLFKFGFRGTFRSRNFESRRFRYAPVRIASINVNDPTSTIFRPDNIRPDGWVVREITRGTDTYDASVDIVGGFGMVDLSLGPKWRIIAGIRAEDAQIQVNTIDPLVPGSRPQTAQLNNTDPLPAVNAVYALTSKQNLRFGWGRTVNRPDFRELSPFEFTNVLGGYSVAGNPTLRRARIDNYDARWEWFLGGDQVIAASYFYKDFTDPIENIFTPTTAELRQSFLNANGARNQGFELELRKNFGQFNPKLAPLSLTTNYTFVDSTVDIPRATATLQLTSLERPLMGQSRHIYNIIVDWTQPRLRSNARFFVNSVSSRLTDVGTFRLPDIIQQRNNFVDFVYQYDILENGRWNFRFTAENLTDNTYRWTQGGTTVRQFQIGRTFSIGTSFSLF